MLFLTENYSALQTLQHFLRDSSLKQDKPPYVLFGSSFPKDKDFTQVICLKNAHIYYVHFRSIEILTTLKFVWKLEELLFC